MAFRGLPTHHLKQPKKIGETLNHLGTNTWQSLILSMVTVGASMVDPAFHGIFLILVILWVVPPPRMPVTTRIITSLVGDPYKPSFATVTGRVDNPCDSQRSHSFLGEKTNGSPPQLQVSRSVGQKNKRRNQTDHTVVKNFMKVS